MAHEQADESVPIAEFPGDFTAFQAATNFAGMATPEPRQARFPEGEWRDGAYLGTFRLVRGRRLYRLGFYPFIGLWRVFLLPQGTKTKRTRGGQG